MDEKNMAKTRMDDLDKEQVEAFMKLVHHTVYTVIQQKEKSTGKPFEVRDDMDMIELTSLAHQAVDVTINTIFALEKQGVEMMKKKFTVIRNEDKE